MKVKFDKAGVRSIAYTVATMMLMGVTATACSDSTDEVLAEEADNNIECSQAYIQLQVQIPNSSATRADAEDSDVTESGDESEYKVNLAYIYLFDASDDEEKQGNFVGEYQTSMIKQETPSFGEITTNGIYWQGQVTTVPAGTYHAYVLINSALSTTVSKESEFLEVRNELKTDSHISLTSSGLPMSSRNTSTGECYVTITPNATNNNAQKAYQFSVNVERCYAKISFHNNTNEFDLYDANTSSKKVIGTVKLVSYKIFNMSSEYFLFRHVTNLDNINNDGTPKDATDFCYGAIGTQWAEGSGQQGVRYPYLYDPNSFSKRIEVSASTVIRKYNGMNVPADAEGTKITSSNTSVLEVPSSYTAMNETKIQSADAFTLGYCLENAMSAVNQKKGYATGIFFRAKITPTEYYAYNTETQKNEKFVSADTAYSGDLYYNEGKFYTSLEAVKVAKGTTDLTDENRSLYAVYYYKHGYCYYRHFIKHYDNNNDQEMGKMEYAIVRNNSYLLSVTSVSMPSMEADTVNINEDVEMEQVYMQAHVTVLPWTVRVNQMELGGY